MRCFLAPLALAGALLLAPAAARDLGQWANQGATIRAWYAGLMQPDNPEISCCGEADAYWTDTFEESAGRYVAVITDERDDGPLGRRHIAPGTRFVVPNAKLKFDDGNPTGHGVIFINSADVVLCYVAPGGT